LTFCSWEQTEFLVICIRRLFYKPTEWPAELP